MHPHQTTRPILSLVIYTGERGNSVNSSGARVASNKLCFIYQKIIKINVYSERDARVLLLCAQHASAAACAGMTVACMRACVFACVLVCVRACCICVHAVYRQQDECGGL